jgi:hypothetical protein
MLLICRCLPWLGKHGIVDQQWGARLTGLQGRHEGAKEADGIFIGQIVRYLTREEGRRVADWLRVKVVVFHEFDTAFQISCPQLPTLA